MSYSLLIGQRSYSSWSLRGWLSFAPFGIPVQVERAVIYSDTFYDDVAAFGGYRTVPAARTPDGGRLTDSLAIAWHLAECFPDRGLLPTDPVNRALAISMIAEMHAGFGALRAACPVNLRTAWADFEPSEDVLADAARAEHIWADALDASGGPFLFGSFTLADAFFAPAVTRFLTYGLAMAAPTRSYARAIVTHPDFVAWRNEGLAEDAEVSHYDMAPLARVRFPNP
ncbi:MAG: glutathione S-transferase [Pseudomonadota bacterium]